MELLNKSSRDAIGIDTVERGLVFALISLQIGLDSTADNSKILFNFAVSTDSRITATVKIKVNKINSLSSLGDYLHNVIPFNNNALNITWQNTSATTVSGSSIPDDPFNLTSLEQYFVWLSLILSTSTFPNISYCKLNISDEDSGTYFKVSLSIPFNYQRFLISGNYLLSVNRVVSSYITNLNQISGNNTMLPSSQFWLDPLPSLTALQNYSITDLIDGTTLVVKGLGLFTLYKNRNDLTPNNTTIIKPNNGTTERWIKYSNSANISLSYSDLTDKPIIPTKTSDLTNDSNFITANTAPVKSVNGLTGNIVLDLSGQGNNNGTPRLIVEDYCQSSSLINNSFLANGYQSLSYNNTGKYRYFPSSGSEGHIGYHIATDINAINCISIKIGLLKSGTDGEYLQIRLNTYNDPVTGTLYRVIFNNSNGGGLFDGSGLIQSFWSNESRGYYDFEFSITKNPWNNNFSCTCNVYQNNRLIFTPNIQQFTIDGTYPLNLQFTGYGSNTQLYYVIVQNSIKNI